MPNSICACILPHARWKSPERACNPCTEDEDIKKLCDKYNSKKQIEQLSYFKNDDDDHDDDELFLWYGWPTKGV